jgi:DnaA family protein
MPGRSGQLVLPFPINEQCVFGNFQVGRNAELLDRLQELPNERRFAGLWLWGANGAGVSHLLQASCQRAAQLDQRVAYLPFARLRHEPDILDGMDGCDLVAIDDAQTWAADDALEAALVGLYQSMLAQQKHLLIGATAPVAHSTFRLADLTSRLAGFGAYQVQPLDDDGKVLLLRRLAAQRGLELTDAVVKFWMARSDRSLSRLLDQLDQLDGAAMSAHRTVTVPLLKDVLGL